jgi:hydroxymethylbilane synthase
MTGRHLTIATRRSQLALAQMRGWARSFVERYAGWTFEELHVTTTGDRVQDRALNAIGGKGLFIKEVEEALLAQRADVAVHSMKDVPAELAPSLVIGCVPEREDPRDVLVTRSGCLLRELPPGSRVGTSSLRRSVQLQDHRPDLQIVPLRGNVDTRLRKCREGEVDAIVLARAGLARLGLLEHATETLAPAICLPAVGQGALAIERREADAELGQMLADASHGETATAVAAERGVMLAVEGSCQIPVAAFAVREGEQMWVRGLLAEADGSRLRRQEARLAWPDTEAEAHQVGLELGRALKQD